MTGGAVRVEPDGPDRLDPMIDEDRIDNSEQSYMAEHAGCIVLERRCPARDRSRPYRESRLCSVWKSGSSDGTPSGARADKSASGGWHPRSGERNCQTQPSSAYCPASVRLELWDGDVVCHTASELLARLR